MHAAVVEGFWITGLANNIEGGQDYKICKAACKFWNELGMRPKVDEACSVVAAEFAANRLPWRCGDVSGLVVPFPGRGKRYDDQPSDEGSEPPDDGVSDSTDDGDDGGGGGRTAVADDVADAADSASSGGPAVAGCTADAGGSSGGLAVAMPSNAIAPLPQEDASAANDHQHNLDVMRSMLAQCKSIGKDALAVQVERWLHSGERRAIHGQASDQP